MQSEIKVININREAHKKARDTYNAAADYYDHSANSFWGRFGQYTVEQLSLTSGARVLDVCCGTGTSAIPAAERVGPRGYVLGVDLAERMLELGRRKAQAKGLTNIEFRTGNMLQLGLPESSFDAVVCVFGIFFVLDIPAAVRELWRLVRPGGQLAITTWGPNFGEPANTVFWDTIRAEQPSLYKGFNPWDLICDPLSVRTVMEAGGARVTEAIAVPGKHPINIPEDWWMMLMGSGYRGTVEQLNDEKRKRVRQVNLDYIRTSGVTEVETNVVYAIATKDTDIRV